jgi:DNA polymerase (family 10)
MELIIAEFVAGEVVKMLSPYCERIAIAGSIRRCRPVVNDIDLVLIPNDRNAIAGVLAKLGRLEMSGMKQARFEMPVRMTQKPSEGNTEVVQGAISIDVYYATPENFVTLLLIRTGSVGNNIRLCSLAKSKGWRLAASGDGLFNERGERIAGDTEKSIYQALGIPWLEPWERG